jgi:hypothetical protein
MIDHMNIPEFLVKEESSKEGKTSTKEVSQEKQEE